MKKRLFFSLLVFLPSGAHAGAWTLPEGTAQVITTTIASSASKSFDADGRAKDDVTFRKFFVSAYAEYGVNDWLTAIAIPEFASAISAAPGRVTQKADDFAIGGGARVRLYDAAGTFSVEALARSAGAFELDTSFNQTPGEDFELRALYGTHFELFGRAGCFDVQIAQRWTTGGRPSETPIDLTVLYDIGDSQVLLQNFNVITQGSGRPPFSYYRYHKVALSLVQPIGDGYSVQFGGFVSPAGQNALREQGFFVGLWTKL